MSKRTLQTDGKIIDNMLEITNYHIELGGVHDQDQEPTDVLFYIDEIGEIPMPVTAALIWRTPQELKSFIEDLVDFYKLMWPDAERINPDADVKKLPLNNLH